MEFTLLAKFELVNSYCEWLYIYIYIVWCNNDYCIEQTIRVYNFNVV